MEVAKRIQKRKLPEVAEYNKISRFPLNELNQDLLERVLSWLPTSSFFRLTSVCRRWKSVANSATFNLACSEIPSRDPWFLMVDSQPNFIQHQPIIFDSTEQNWKKLNPLPLHHLNQNQNSYNNFILVAASGGLICLHNPNSNNFIITNPVTGTSRELTSFDSIPQQPIHAISMISKPKKIKLFVISGELPNLKLHQYNTITNKWEDEITLDRKPQFETLDDDSTQYFLTKCGYVVSTDMQRNPCKQYSSILTTKNDDEVLYFLSSSGRVVSCNLTHRSFFEYPRLLPAFSEFSIDLISYMDEMYVVLLSEFFESASVHVWRWDEGKQFWDRVAAMPPWMSQKFYGKNVDVNCVVAGNQMMVCLSSEEICGCVLYSFVKDEWIELPRCEVNGEDEEFVCAFSFEPRIEAVV